MKKQVGKSVSLLLAVCMLVTLFAGVVSAQELHTALPETAEAAVQEEGLSEIEAAEDALLEEIGSSADTDAETVSETSVGNEADEEIFGTPFESEDPAEDTEEAEAEAEEEETAAETQNYEAPEAEAADEIVEEISAAGDSRAVVPVDAPAVKTESADTGVPVVSLQEETRQAVEIPKAVARLAAPVLKKATAAEKGIKITWAKVAGAAGYRVFRKVPGGSWEEIGTTKGASYVDETAAAGTLYSYTVNTYTSDNVRGNYDKAGLATLYLPKVKLKSAVNRGNTVVVKWKKVTGADGYRVYKRKKGATAWTTVQRKGTALSFIDEAGSSGTAYEYYVKAYRQINGTYYFGFGDETATIVHTKLDMPQVSSILTVSKGIRITWKKVTGAEKYIVYRKVGKDGAWKAIKTLKKTAYTDTAAKKGKTYYYAIAAKKGSTLSGKKKNGIAGARLQAPVLKSISATDRGVQLTWKQLKNAAAYYVYRKQSGGEYHRIAKTSDVTYVDPHTVSGQKYTYRVRAVTKEAPNCLSQYDRKGLSVKAKNLTGIFQINGKKYYFKNGIKKKGWQMIDGKWYFFKKTNGRMIAGAEYTIDHIKYHFRANGVCIDYQEGSVSDAMIEKAQGYASATNWLILVDCGRNRCSVFNGSKGNWKQVYFWPCTTGRASAQTVKGQYSINGNRGYSFGDGTYTCYWFSSFYGPYLFHSVKYYPGTMKLKDGRLGMSLSLGCVRLDIKNAKWIYDNIPIGTKVVTYK